MRLAALVEEDLADGLAVELGDAREVFLVPAAFLDQPRDLAGQPVALRRRTNGEDRITVRRKRVGRMGS